jgi:hypothetical protein
MIKKKVSLFIVQGFGYSGSSAVAEYLATIAGRPKAYIAESVLLKSFFSLAYASYIGHELSPRRKKRLTNIFLVKESNIKGEEEWENARALLDKSNIPEELYLEKAKIALEIFNESSKINNDKDRKKLVVEAATNYFYFVTKEIEKNLGVVVYDNLVNAHLSYWLQVLDLSRFESVYIYSIYRKNLKDQFFEQVKNSQHHAIDTANNINFFLFYLYTKLRPLIDKKDDTREGGVGLIPIGSYQFINDYSIKLYWSFFIKDLRKRLNMYQDGLVHIVEQDVITNRIMAFEDFVGDDESLRDLLQTDFSKISTSIDSKEFMNDFEYKKSQKNIKCYEKWEDRHLISNLLPNSTDEILEELKVRINEK